MERDIGLARRENFLSEGRVTALKLLKLGQLAPADDFDAYESSSDDFADDVISQTHIREIIAEPK